MSPSKHAREAARARAERQAAKRAAAARKRRNTQIAVAGTVVVVLAIVGVIALAANGKDKKTNTLSEPQPTAASTTPAATSATVPAGSCAYPKSARPATRDVGTPPAKPAGKLVNAALTTSVGAIGFTMDGTKAPCTANAFTYLASKGYFDNTPCHRLTTAGIFVLQCGSPTGTGSGGPGFSFADENLTGLGTAAGAQAVYPAGTVAMANSGPNTNGSQFFLVYKDSPLSASYTPLGRITSGLDKLVKVGADGIAGGARDGAPKDKVTIESFKVS